MKIDVTKVAKLANLPLDKKQTPALATQFGKTVDFVNQLQEVDVKDVKPTSQVTGLTNVWREDEVDTSRILRQKQALSNASKTHKGFFVVPRLID